MSFYYPSSATTLASPSVKQKEVSPVIDPLYKDIPIVMTVDQMAKILLIGRNAAYSLIRNGAVKSIKNGRNIRVTRGALIEYLNSAPV